MPIGRSLLRPVGRLKLPDALDRYDRENERQMRREVEEAIQQTSTLLTNTILGLPRPYIYAQDYGVVGDGNHDDTEAFQRALDAASALHKILYCGSLVIRISSACTLSGGGLTFDIASFGNNGDPGIYVTGSGYTALTISGICFVDSVTIYGTTTSGGMITANAIQNSNATFSQFSKLRVVNFDGFGWKINDLWDCSLIDCSIELCGNASHYAFSMQSALADTCNMSHIMRLQVERSNKKAIFIDPSTLSCVFDNIHSEQATGDVLYNTWDIGAARSVFNGGRFHANNPASAKISLHGENSVIEAYNAQDMTVQLDGSSGQRLCLVQPNFNGSTVSVNTANHSGPIVIIGGDLGSITTGLETTYKPALTIIGAGINTLTVGDVGNPGLPERFHVEKCRIALLASGSTNSAAVLTDCTVDDLGTGLGYLLKLVRGDATVHSGGSAIPSLITDSAHIIGNLTISESAILSGRTIVEGNLTGSTSTILGADVLVTGTATGLGGAPTGAPNVHLQLPSNLWPVGASHWVNPPVSATPFGFRCTVSAGAGTWKSMGNLA